MGLTVQSVDVWAAEIRDEPGGLSNKLAALAAAGADLDFIVARRCPDKPGAGVVFVTPLRGDAEVAAATDVGFAVTQSLHSVRIEGDNQAGIGARLTDKLGQAGISLRGLSAAVTGVRFIMYFALDSAADAAKAIQILQEA